MIMTQDFKAMRRRRERQYAIRKYTAIAVLLLIVLLLYVFRDKWFAKLEGIGSKYENAAQTNASDSASFPIPISGGINYQTGISDNNFVLLGDTGYKIYTTDGKLIANRQHAYSSPILKTAAKRILVYDLNGTSFRVDSKNKEIYSITTENKILFARISNEGYTAVVTESDMYVCALSVYDDKGVNIYNFGSRERIIDLTFDNGSTGCCCVVLTAKGGQINSYAKHFGFTSTESDWKTENLETLAVHSVSAAESLTLIGDTKLAVYSNAGEMKMLYTFDNTLADFDSANGKTAMLLRNEDRRTTTLVLAEDTAQSPVEVYFDEKPQKLRVCDDKVYLFSNTKIIAYDFKGIQLGSADISTGFEDFLKVNSSVFLLGFDKIDRITFTS